MIDNEFLKKQLETAKSSIKILKQQNETLGLTIKEVIKNVPDDEKNEIERLQVLSKKAFNFAKDGNIDKANELIKKFKDGRKNNRS